MGIEQHNANLDYRLHNPIDCAKKVDAAYPIGQCGKALREAMNDREDAIRCIQALHKLVNAIQVPEEKFGFNRTDEQVKNMLGIVGKRVKRGPGALGRTVRPVMLDKGKLYYVRCEMLKYKSVAFTWGDNLKGKRAADIEPIDDLDNGRFVMLSMWGYYGLFKPSLYEVMQFVPEKYLNPKEQASQGDAKFGDNWRTTAKSPSLNRAGTPLSSSFDSVGNREADRIVAFRILGDEQVPWDSKVDDEHSSMGPRHIVGSFHWAWVQAYRRKRS